MRIECPVCGTSYRVAHLGLKTNHGDKGIVRCMCGRSLEVEFHHTEEPEVKQRFRDRLLRRPVAMKKVIHARVTASTR